MKFLRGMSQKMTDYAATASLPVVFSDGEREIDIGNVSIYASMEFKDFISVLSQKIGIAPHQISVSLICRKKSKSFGTRRIVINERVNFGLILLEKNCHFLAVLKRSRRERRGKPHQNLEGDEYFTSSPIEILQKKFLSSPPEKMLLRRDLGVKSSQPGFVSPLYGQITSTDSIYPGQGIGSGFFDYESQMRNLHIQREKYLMSAISYPSTKIEDEYVYLREGDRISKGYIVCEVCSSAKGESIPFHSCVNDTITEGFRSPAGPIARPSKGFF